VAFSPGGKTRAPFSNDGTVELWQLDLSGWKTQLCKIVNRKLTPEEWQQFLWDEPYRKTCKG
jgi:hypothetical protein